MTMNQDYEALKKRIYELMNGEYDLRICDMEESRWVTDEYAEGAYCTRLYGEMQEAYYRIAARFGVAEDEDAHIVRGRMEEICEYMSKKMFDYGVYCAQNGLLQEK